MRVKGKRKKEEERSERPNLGKSTLISRISASLPRIADYRFAMLEPILGVVAIGDSGGQRRVVYRNCTEAD